MSNAAHSQPVTHTCQICSAEVGELRRGRCWGCYNRWVEERPVGIGASCTFCGERRRDRLRSLELLGAWVPTCHNCAGRTAKLSPMPTSIPEIRSVLTRDRRRRDRRIGLNDNRVFQLDRRNDDRRLDYQGDEELTLVDDDMIVEIQELADAIVASRPANGELTGIRPMPMPVRGPSDR